MPRQYELTTHLGVTQTLPRGTLTVLKRAADTPNRGLMDRMTRVSFQPFTKPMMKEAKKVVKDWMRVPILSPMPSWIL